LSKKDFEGCIFEYILKNPQRFYLFNWREDKRIDYLCWLYPRLSKAIDAYRDIGSSFEAYIGSLVHWSAREYRSQEANHEVTEYACWKARAEESELGEDEAPYLESEKRPRENPRHILVLLLKSYALVSDDFLEHIAKSIGMKAERLKALVSRIKEKRARRDEEIRWLRECIYSQYYRCISFEERLDAEAKGTARYEELEGKVERAKERMGRMRRRLASARTDASNRQVAEVLGIPKGTVDSNLHAIKRKLGSEQAVGLGGPPSGGLSPQGAAPPALG
jgi:uncharacterized protein with von Willebrand factor type A (vWA) domain